MVVAVLVRGLYKSSCRINKRVVIVVEELRDNGVFDETGCNATQVMQLETILKYIIEKIHLECHKSLQKSFSTITY